MFSVKNYLEKVEVEDFELCDLDSKLLKKHLFKIDMPLVSSINKSKVREESIHYALEDISYFSGSLSFIFLQNLSASAYFNKLDQSKLLQLNDIQYNCGIAFAHLRNNKVFVDGIEENNEVVLNGILPWASGYNIFDYLLIGFHLGNKECIAWCNFSNNDGFSISDPMDTFVASSINTVSIRLDNFKINAENIISLEDIGTFNNLLGNSSRMPSLITGIISRSIDLIPDTFIEEKESFRKQLNIVRTFILDKYDALFTRKESLKLAQMVTTFCAVANGGKSTLLNNSIQRLYRESLLFSLSGVSPDIVNKYKLEALNYKIDR